MTGGNMTPEKLIFWLGELGKEHANLVGKKCANLGELTKAGFQVPPGFALSLEAYEEFLTTTSTIDEIRQYFATFSADPSNPKDMPKYTEASRTARSIMESKAMPKNMEDSVARYYDELCRKTGIKDVAVAVRSAGPVSHPGQYETYLDIAGTGNVRDNIVKVWSSTFNTRSLVARARKGLPLEHDPIGVAVLQMIRPKAAGIMFTAEPTTADSSKLVIEGIWGLGESVVSGAVIPDYWVVDKTMLEIVERRVSPKPAERNLHLEATKALSSDTIPDRQEGCLSDEEVIELTKRGKSIEQYFGSPQDVEWALASDLPGDSIVILQTRPEHFRVSIAGF